MGPLTYIKQILLDLKGEVDSNTIVIGGLKTPLPSLDKSSRQKINKDSSMLNCTIEQMDLIDIYKTFLAAATVCTFSSSALATFSRTDHALGPNKSQFRKFEIIPCIFSDHN